VNAEKEYPHSLARLRRTWPPCGSSTAGGSKNYRKLSMNQKFHRTEILTAIAVKSSQNILPMWSLWKSFSKKLATNLWFFIPSHDVAASPSLKTGELSSCSWMFVTALRWDGMSVFPPQFESKFTVRERSPIHLENVNIPNHGERKDIFCFWFSI
jgi:hypothetical protein